MLTHAATADDSHDKVVGLPMSRAERPTKSVPEVGGSPRIRPAPVGFGESYRLEEIAGWTRVQQGVWMYGYGGQWDALTEKYSLMVSPTTTARRQLTGNMENAMPQAAGMVGPSIVVPGWEPPVAPKRLCRDRGTGSIIGILGTLGPVITIPLMIGSMDFLRAQAVALTAGKVV